MGKYYIFHFPLGNQSALVNVRKDILENNEFSYELLTLIYVISSFHFLQQKKWLILCFPFTFAYELQGLFTGNMPDSGG